MKNTTPVNSNFVLKNGKGEKTENGLYYHFSEVVTLIRLTRELQHEATKKACKNKNDIGIPDI